MALYKDVHPEYASYLYLMAPISLALLNPIGLVLMEISKIIQTKAEAVSNIHVGQFSYKFVKTPINAGTRIEHVSGYLLGRAADKAHSLFG